MAQTVKGLDTSTIRCDCCETIGNRECVRALSYLQQHGPYERPDIFEREGMAAFASGDCQQSMCEPREDLVFSPDPVPEEPLTEAPELPAPAPAPEPSSSARWSWWWLLVAAALLTLAHLRGG